MADTQEIDISVGIDAILEKGFSLLENHQWKRARRYFEAGTQVAPKNAYSYLGILLTTLKLPDIDSLGDSPRSFAGSENYKKALLFADAKLKKKLENCTLKYQNKCEEKYQNALDQLSQAKSKWDYSRCYNLFSELGNYKDSKEKKEYCKDKEESLASDTPATYSSSCSKKSTLSQAGAILGLFAIVLLIALFLVAVLLDGDDYSYYIDENGNGKEDWGEGVWYEDGDRVYFYD